MNHRIIEKNLKKKTSLIELKACKKLLLEQVELCKEFNTRYLNSDHDNPDFDHMEQIYYLSQNLFDQLTLVENRINEIELKRKAS